MDVRCERCQTEYDFDDALVSDRGTTVKCTNCGYQFRVFPVRGAGGVEVWAVRSAAGVEVTYTSLRDLQRGIQQGSVAPDDLLLREGHPPRPLRAIAELEPFFGTKVSAEKVKRTLVGVAPPASIIATDVGAGAPPRGAEASRSPAEGSARIRTTATKLPRLPGDGLVPGPAAASEPPPETRPRVQGEGSKGVRPAPRPAPPAIPAPAGGDPGSPVDVQGMDAPVTPRVPDRIAPGPSIEITAAVAAPATEPVPARVAESPARDAAPAVVDSGKVGEAPASAPPSAPQTALREDWQEEVPAPPPVEFEPGTAGEPVPVPTVDPREQFHTPAPRELSFSGPLSDADPRFVPPSRARPVRMRWIVAVVMVGGVLLLASTLGLSRLRGLMERGAEPGPPSAASSSLDSRAAALLAQGRRQLGAGELEAAAESFTKASVYAEGEPAVLGALAELEIVRADRLWLRRRLLDAAATDRARDTERELAGRQVRVAAAVEAALGTALPPLQALRLRVDRLRLEGKLDAARGQVAPLAERASEPEAAYALGMLDLAESVPALRSAAARLRVAAAGEGRLGRARAALVYALARAGEGEAAARELQLLASVAPEHPLFEELTRFVERMKSGMPEAEASAGPLPNAAVGTPGPQRQATREGATDGDFRQRLERASVALADGDQAGAERLYRSVLADQPGNTEALAGLAEVARQRNDPKAGELYEQVLKKNPSYVPALVARADQLWATGDRAAAVALYQRVVAQVGTGSSYGRHAASRIAVAARGDPDESEEAPAPVETGVESGADTVDRTEVSP